MHVVQPDARTSRYNGVINVVLIVFIINTLRVLLRPEAPKQKVSSELRLPCCSCDSATEGGRGTIRDNVRVCLARRGLSLRRLICGSADEKAFYGTRSDLFASYLTHLTVTSTRSPWPTYCSRRHTHAHARINTQLQRLYYYFHLLPFFDTPLI